MDQERQKKLYELRRHKVRDTKKARGILESMGSPKHGYKGIVENANQNYEQDNTYNLSTGKPAELTDGVLVAFQQNKPIKHIKGDYKKEKLLTK